jgi:hypothetical protein
LGPGGEGRIRGAGRSGCGSSTSTAARREYFIIGLDDALQAHRFWASDVDRQVRGRGIDNLLRAWQKAHTRVPVSHDGRLLLVPREIGTARRTTAGAVRHEQRLFDYLTWDEIKAKRQEYLRQQRTYSDLVATLDKLLALADVVPQTANPAEAAEAIGITVENWLLGQPPGMTA